MEKPGEELDERRDWLGAKWDGHDLVPHGDEHVSDGGEAANGAGMDRVRLDGVGVANNGQHVAPNREHVLRSLDGRLIGLALTFKFLRKPTTGQ